MRNLIINLCGWFICFSISTLYGYLNLTNTYTTTTIYLTSIRILYVIIYSMSFVASYIFVISMLYHSFLDSEFQISRCTLSIHLSFTILLFLICAFATFFIHVYPFWIGGILTFLNVLIYVIGLCSMIYTLNMKLIKMILMANSHCSSKYQQNFMKTVIKLSVLQGLFTFSASIYVIVSVAHNLIFYSDWSYLMDWSVYTITIGLGTMCMFLTVCCY